MLAEAYIENSQMRVVNFPKEFLKSKHWKINIEPVEEINDELSDEDSIFGMWKDRVIDVNNSVRSLRKRRVFDGI